MRTARFPSSGEGRGSAHPLDADPLPWIQAPTWMQTPSPWMQIPPPMQTHPDHVTCDAYWEAKIKVLPSQGCKDSSK